MWPDGGDRNPLLTTDGVEACCAADRVKLLGAAFLLGLRAQGFSLRPLLTAVLRADDSAILASLYPDLPTMDAAKSAAIRRNNSGPFALYAVAHPEFPAAAALLSELDEQKRRFRAAVEACVPARPALVRDNLVHSPRDEAEMEFQLRIFGALASRTAP
jgi:hypothetical protein